MSRQVRAVVAITAAAAALLLLLAAPLNPRGFVAGDPGLKLIAARNAIAHPRQPLQIDLPMVAARPVAYVDRFFRRHESHAHILQSPLFPLVSAPFIAVGGLRGAYVLPLVGFIALLPLAYALLRRTIPDASLLAWGASAVLANPLFFYAFEFWEHVPAVVCLAAGTLLAFARAPRPVTDLAAGVLVGVGALLRPEGTFYALTLGGVVAWRGAWMHYAAGVSAVLGLYVGANYLESARLAGDHVTANLAALPDRWLETRWSRFAAWVAPSPLVAVGLLGMAAAWAIRRRLSAELAQVVGLVAALVIVSAVSRQTSPDALWLAWPIGTLILVPLRSYAGLRQMYWLAGGTSLAVWLTSTHDGGAQWGPRILLISAPAFIVLAAAAIRDLTLPGALRGARIAMVVAVVACGGWASRHAYVDLRGWKRYYASLVTALELQTAPGTYIVTNVWWLDQIAAPLYPSRTFLVTTSSRETAEVLQLLAGAGTRSVTLAWSRESGEAGRMETIGTCYAVELEVEIPERQMVLARATCPGAAEAWPAIRR